MNLTYQETDLTLFMLCCNYFNTSTLSIILLNAICIQVFYHSTHSAQHMM